MINEKMVVSYARLSNKDSNAKNDYSESIYNQTSIMNEYAKKMNFHINKEYIDDGYSGINFERPAFEKLISDIQAGLIDTVITKDISRLGRDFIDTVYYISEYFPKYNIRFIAVDDCYDSNNLSDFQKNSLVQIKSVINSQHVRDTSIKRKQVSLTKTNNKEFIGFTAPYGYKVVKKDKKRFLEVDEYSASIVKRIFSSIASGMSRKEVADVLNNEKIAPPVIYMNITPSKNKKYYYDWTDKIIYRIIKNKTYTGSIIVRKSEKKDFRQKKRKWIPIRDRKEISDAHTAIVSNELFIEANSKLKSNARRQKNNYDGTLKGLVFCGCCDNEMTACRKTKNGKEVYYFSCNKTINRKKCDNRTLYDSKLRTILEDNIKDLIKVYVNSDDAINDVMKEVNQKHRPKMKIENINKAIENCDMRLKGIYLSKTKGNISLEEFIKRKKDISLEKEKLEFNLKELIEKMNCEEKKNELIDIYNKFIKKDIMAKEYIKSLIKKVIINKDNTIEIIFKFGVGKTKNIKLY